MGLKLVLSDEDKFNKSFIFFYTNLEGYEDVSNDAELKEFREEALTLFNAIKQRDKPNVYGHIVNNILYK